MVTCEFRQQEIRETGEVLMISVKNNREDGDISRRLRRKADSQRRDMVIKHFSMFQS